MNDTQISAGIDLLFTGIFLILPIVMYPILNRTIKNEIKATIAKKVPTPLRILGYYLEIVFIFAYLQDLNLIGGITSLDVPWNIVIMFLCFVDSLMIVSGIGLRKLKVWALQTTTYAIIAKITLTLVLLPWQGQTISRDYIGGYTRTWSVNTYIWIIFFTLIPILIYLLRSDQVKEAFAVYK